MEDIKAEVIKYGLFNTEGVLAMWNRAGAEAVQRTIGGCGDIPPEEILFLALCQLTRDSHEELHLDARLVRDVQERTLRVLWGIERFEWPRLACPSSEWSLHGQSTRELGDALHSLSSACAAQAAIREGIAMMKAGSGFPLAVGKVPGRVGLLRGAGNAIVPALAAEFIAAWMETQRDCTP
jgi:hypothetical protein